MYKLDFAPVLNALTQKFGKTVTLDDYQAAHGGCISDAYVLCTNVLKVFVKVAHQSKSQMLRAEREGLAALAQVGVLKVPEVVGLVESSDHAFLILEYLELTSLTTNQQRELGQDLAKHHQVSATESQADRFGWHQNNFIGATPQENSWGSSWPVFFAQYRLAFQLELLQRKGVASSLANLVSELIANIPRYFEAYQPKPVLVHGDLWAGNASGSKLGPVCYDPAVYYADREVDLAMTELFGGFSQDFYRGYEEVWPLDSGYKDRVPLYNLYHILNHVNLFGSSYEAQANQLARLCLKSLV